MIYLTVVNRSLGVILYCLVLGYLPFEDPQHIIDADPIPAEGVSSGMHTSSLHFLSILICFFFFQKNWWIYSRGSSSMRVPRDTQWNNCACIPGPIRDVTCSSELSPRAWYTL